MLNLFYMSGSLMKKTYPKEKAFHKLTLPCHMNLVMKRPGIYLRELQEELKSMLEVEVSHVVRNMHISASVGSPGKS